MAEPLPASRRLRRTSGRVPRPPSELLAALVALSIVVGCAQPAFMPWVDGPRDLRERATTALREGDLEAAYEHLAEIRQRYPESAEASEVFLLTAKIFRRLWRGYRFVEERDAWRTEQTRFMFAWLGSESRDGFPRAEAEMLLLQMPWSYWGEFEAYARTDPHLSQWEIRAEEDNGRIEALRISGPRDAASIGS